MLFNKFLFRLSMYALVVKTHGTQMAIFLRHFCVLYFQQSACSTFQTCVLNSHLECGHDSTLYQIAECEFFDLNSVDYFAPLSQMERGHSLPTLMRHH